MGKRVTVQLPIFLLLYFLGGIVLLFLLPPCALAALFVTDFLVTGRQSGRQVVSFRFVGRWLGGLWAFLNKPQPVEKEAEGCFTMLFSLALLCVLAVVLFNGTRIVLFLLAESPLVMSALCFAAYLVPLTILLECRRSRQTFAEVMWPTLHDERKEAVRAARTEARRFYGQHAALLRVVHPPALFASTLNALVPDSATAEAAWKSARKLISQLQEIVRAAEQERDALEQKNKPAGPAPVPTAEIERMIQHMLRDGMTPEQIAAQIARMVGESEGKPTTTGNLYE